MRRGQAAIVYVMEDEGGRRKVGHSVSPMRRSIELSGGTEPLRIAYKSARSEHACKIESAAHRLLKLAGKHIEGELFSASVEECIQAIERAERIVAGLEPDVLNGGEQVGVRFDAADVEAIDAWRRVQARIPTLADAVRQLVRKGLAADKEGAKERKK